MKKAIYRFIMMLSFMCIMIFAVSLPVSARPDQIILINKNNPDDVKAYNYTDLNNSFAAYKGAQPCAYYTSFRNCIVGTGAQYKIFAFHDDTSKIYVDYAAANADFALIKGKNADGTDIVKFNLAKYTSQTDPRFPNPETANMPAAITLVIANSDPGAAPTTQVIPTPDLAATGPTLSGITLQGIEPEITGTDTAPELTFTVTPDTVYTTGTAVLSEDVNYTIENKDYYIGTPESPCTATTSDNLVQLALDLLRMVTGNSSLNGVSGSTLIANSPLIITLMGASGTTVYTVNFVAAAP
jgi:hypothetical protein